MRRILELAHAGQQREPADWVQGRWVPERQVTLSYFMSNILGNDMSDTVKDVPWLDEMREETIIESCYVDENTGHLAIETRDTVILNIASSIRAADEAAIPGITELTLAVANRPELMPALLAVARGEAVAAILANAAEGGRVIAETISNSSWCGLRSDRRAGDPTPLAPEGYPAWRWNGRHNATQLDYADVARSVCGAMAANPGAKS